MGARAGKLFDAALAAFAAIILVALLAVVTAGIVSRGVGRPFAWTDELSGFLMVWLACAGWMIATRRQAHIRIRVFQDRLPVGPWRASEIVIQLGVMLLGAVIAWRSLALMEANWDVEAIAMPVATAWLYVPLLPAGILTVAQGALELWRARRPNPETEAVIS